MNVDVLYDLMKVSRDKKNTLLFFLDKTLGDEIRDYTFIEDVDKLYLNDMVYCIKKNTLQLDIKGKLSKIDDSMLSIIVYSNRFTVTISFDEYYVFIKPLQRKSKDSDREFYESLLKMIQ